MHNHLIACLAIGMLAAAAVPVDAAAQAPLRAKTGTLTCDTSGDIGLIVTAKKRLICLFTPARPGPREVYSGAIVKFGADAAKAAGAEMVWTVYAPANRRFGILAGQYGGAAARKSAGGNTLVGGSASAVTLQPMVTEGEGGANLATSVVALELHPAR
ncbi:MAG: DUF992 domain-containing protein [Pseudolabrys sp.]|nr:DUF992 domain-containing protein [Pseudolabrys sp.]